MATSIEPTLRLSQIPNKQKLLEELTAVDISVPPANEQRQRNRKRELWSACRLISTLADYNRLAYPISLFVRSDNISPDCVIDVPSHQVGLEITSTPCTDYLDVIKDAEERCPEEYFLESSPAGFRVYSASDQNSERSLPPWQGGRPEKEWALSIKSAMQDKTEKLAREQFEKKNLNWLLVYSNTPFPIDFELALSGLDLSDFFAKCPRFDVLYIEHGGRIAAVTPDNIEIFRVNDLGSAQRAEAE